MMCARYLMLMDCQEFDAFIFNQNRDDSEGLHFRDFDRKKSLKLFNERYQTSTIEQMEESEDNMTNEQAYRRRVYFCISAH